MHPAGSPEARSRLRELASRIPKERRASASVIEVVPEGEFVTYALGIPLRKMLDPTAAQARVSVSREGRT